MSKIQQFNYSVNLLQSILWQYDESTNLVSLINQKQDWYNTNQTEFWSSWYTNVFNLQTANLFGLAVWSIILNIPIFVPFEPEPEDKPLWGFNAYTTPPALENTYLNYGFGNFSSQGQDIELTEEQQRFLLRLRYFKLVTRADIIDINNFLNYLVSTSSIGFTGQIYALDGLNMTLKYIITNSTFPINLLAAIVRLDVFPRPAGVGIKSIVISAGGIWGFNSLPLENGYTNFGYGTFYTDYF